MQPRKHEDTKKKKDSIGGGQSFAKGPGVPEHIGFIGLGVMGKPMAKHLVAAVTT